MNKEKILDIKNLSVSLCGKKNKEKQIIKNVNLQLYAGECLGILGESGSGKSMAMKAILGLLEPNFKIEGSALFLGKDLFKEKKENLRRHRGKDITMILQNPMTCFDPLYRIAEQIAETWLSHNAISRTKIEEKAIKMLDSMQIKNGSEVLKKYPHQLSGGMLQRITIGLALSMEPKILVADEPTTAIDAITQYEIMKEFEKIKEKRENAMIFIRHDLSVISQIADRIIVMNDGRIVDEGDFHSILNNAKDPYTKQLIASKTMVMERYKQVLLGGIQ